eukprot:CAMPEP_0184297004 /NCGR_PEP_ID=MMETSP1049-20130417/7945_1 /TAXON_ID=77928 /ORGANISM="Proteomonas sulcata, Strain CCMP704" /LENGTH=284 /DNA_ID=CAMNT_0026606523 /DNA_START=26 /DNA_END=880 /DNA_ORIENTATION=+
MAAALILTALLAGDQDGQANGPVSTSMSKAEVKSMFRHQVPFQDYPTWTKSLSQINEAGKVNHGVWEYYKGPPFLQRVTMFSGNDVDITYSGNLVRRIIGLPLNFGKWEGNYFINNFEGQQMRFLQSNKHSVIVVPPLSEGNEPLLTDRAKERLHHYMAKGHNTLVVCGGPAALHWINVNFFPLTGRRLLDPAWTRGPYEKQEITVGTPFQTLPVTLPNDNNHVHGARLASLPMEAKSYFETKDVSVVFSLNFGEGQLLFIGYDYSYLSKPWVKTLIAGMEFAS